MELVKVSMVAPVLEIERLVAPACSLMVVAAFELPLAPVPPMSTVWAAPDDVAMFRAVVLAVVPVTPMLMVLLLALLPMFIVVLAMSEVVAVVVALPKVMAVAVVVPMFRAPEMESRVGVRTDVLP